MHPSNLHQDAAEQGAEAAAAAGGGAAQGERGKNEQQTGRPGAALSATSQQRQDQDQVIPSIFSNKDLGQSIPSPTFMSTFCAPLCNQTADTGTGSPRLVAVLFQMQHKTAMARPGTALEEVPFHLSQP